MDPTRSMVPVHLPCVVVSFPLSFLQHFWTISFLRFGFRKLSVVDVPPVIWPLCVSKEFVWPPSGGHSIRHGLAVRPCGTWSIPHSGAPFPFFGELLPVTGPGLFVRFARVRTSHYSTETFYTTPPFPSLFHCICRASSSCGILPASLPPLPFRFHDASFHVLFFVLFLRSLTFLQQGAAP